MILQIVRESMAPPLIPSQARFVSPRVRFGGEGKGGEGLILMPCSPVNYSSIM